MGLFKRKKSRQEKITDIDVAHPDPPDVKATAKADHDKESGEVLNALADMPITEHLIELRRHLIKICVAVLVIFLGLAGFSRELYNFLSDPLVAQLPANSTMIATDIIQLYGTDTTDRFCCRVFGDALYSLPNLVICRAWLV